MLATAILPLLLLVATVSASTAPASASPSQINVCSSSYLNACRKITVPTGFYLNKDGNGQIVGISINTTTTFPCTPTMKAAHQQLLIICGCISTLEDRLKKAPALSRPGMTRALDYFTGVTAAVLAGEHAHQQYMAAIRSRPIQQFECKPIQLSNFCMSNATNQINCLLPDDILQRSFPLIFTSQQQPQC
jgi:hypothetical protein